MNTLQKVKNYVKIKLQNLGGITDMRKIRLGGTYHRAVNGKTVKLLGVVPNEDKTESLAFVRYVGTDTYGKVPLRLLKRGVF
jgi:hypothetical protein